MNGGLNEVTNTVHKHAFRDPELGSVCGATSTLDRDHLRKTRISKAIADPDTNRCGRCFEDAGGY